MPDETPPPIWTARAIWTLDAAPATLEAAAGALRGLGTAAGTARGTVDREADQVFAGGAWEGETADAYQDHRAKLSGDLTGLAESAVPAADALEQVAAVLRLGQARLDDAREALSAVPVLVWPWGTVFYPRDGAEATLVQDAVSAAREIRQRVDEEILLPTGAFRTAGTGLSTISQTWQPRSVRHVNLNAGMGRREGTTTRGDLDELAEAIAVGNPDVVTLQEVYSRNLYGDRGLLARLEDETGAGWEVAAFAPGTRAVPNDPDNPGEQPFGNAILVRTGGVVEDHDRLPRVELDRPVDPAGDLPEGRAAAVAALTIREPG